MVVIASTNKLKPASVLIITICKVTCSQLCFFTSRPLTRGVFESQKPPLSTINYLLPWVINKAKSCATDDFISVVKDTLCKNNNSIIFSQENDPA